MNRSGKRNNTPVSSKINVLLAYANIMLAMAMAD